MNSLPLFSANQNALFNDIAAAMASIGYVGELLVENSIYTRSTARSNQPQTGVIEMAGYARTPTDYRNSCIGITIANGFRGAGLVANHRDLGAPLMFEVGDDYVNRYKVTAKGDPELIETILPNQIMGAFRRNKDLWCPDHIYRAKVEGDADKVTQLDFFDIGLLPLLEGQIHKKLDRLLKELLAAMVHRYEKAHLALSHEVYQEIYRIIFRLIVAKVMKDRGRPATPRHNAVAILKAVEKYYNPPTKVSLDSDVKRDVIEIAWHIVSGGFQFQNLSVDDLAFVYESSLVTKDSRKIFGTHSTPPRVAEYVMRKLPIAECVPDPADRYVFEPCAGHGGFLVAAMRRLRELLGDQDSILTRHKYLTEHLAAFEIESFALEAGWSRLVMADYPHPNGWRLIKGDIFTDQDFYTELQRCRILLCNPPFESLDDKERMFYAGLDLLHKKPAEILKRFLEFPPDLMGLILPSSFNTASVFRPFHRILAETYGQIEVVALPEIFKYSLATTVVVLASHKRNYHGKTVTKSRRVAKDELEDFIYRGIEPAASERTYDASEYLRHDFCLWTPPLNHVWEYLKDREKVSHIVSEMHYGIRWKTFDDEQGTKKRSERKEISDVPLEGYKLGYPKAESHLKQFSLESPRYLSANDGDQETDAAKVLPWEKPKVAMNEIRIGRKGWRLGAVADITGHLFSRSFFLLWPVEKLSVYAVAAVLNGPVANAYMFAVEDAKYNHMANIRDIPIISQDAMTNGGKIDKLARVLDGQIQQRKFDDAKNTLLKLDAEILRNYDLPQRYETELLNIFQGVKRPLPFDFQGYYPENFTGDFPLHEIVSESFTLAKAENLTKRLPAIQDKELAQYLDSFFADEESEDD